MYHVPIQSYPKQENFKETVSSLLTFKSSNVYETRAGGHKTLKRKVQCVDETEWMPYTISFNIDEKPRNNLEARRNDCNKYMN